MSLEYTPDSSLERSFDPRAISSSTSSSVSQGPTVKSSLGHSVSYTCIFRGTGLLERLSLALIHGQLPARLEASPLHLSRARLSCSQLEGCITK